MAAEALRSLTAALQTLALTNRLRLQAEQIVARASVVRHPNGGSLGPVPFEGRRVWDTLRGWLLHLPPPPAPDALGAAEKFQVLPRGPLGHLFCQLPSSQCVPIRLSTLNSLS